MNVDTTIIIAIIAAAGAVLGTWLTMRGQVLTAQASIIGCYTGLVADLRVQITELKNEVLTLGIEVGNLHSIVAERDGKIEHLETMIVSVLNTTSRRGDSWTGPGTRSTDAPNKNEA